MEGGTPNIAATGRGEVKSRARLWLEKRWLQFLLLGVLGFLVRLPALQGQLVWDDQYLARDNPFIKSPILILEAFRHHLFLDSFSAHYRPVQNISFMFDYFFWNTETCGYHLTNIMLHVGSGLVLFRLLLLVVPGLCRSIRDTNYIALSVATLWMVHPVHSAAVDYISGRADSLAFLFAGAAWLLVLSAQRSKRTWRKAMTFAAAAAVAMLALCSRETACIWVVIFAVHQIFFSPALSKRAKLSVCTSCAVLIVTYIALRHLPSARTSHGPSEGWSAPTRVVLMFRALGDYARLMMFPSNLHMERTVVHPGVYMTSDSWEKAATIEYLSITGLLAVAGFAVGILRKGKARMLRIFGVVWFVAGFLPISNLVDLNATVAEHWLYLPSVGLLLFMAGCVIDFPFRLRSVAYAVGLIALVGFSVRSFVRSSDWVTPETFYRRTLAAGGASTRVQVNLAQIYAGRGEYAKAEAIFRAALRILPDYPIARNNLAHVLYEQGKTAEAEAIFSATSNDAVKTRNDYPRTWIAVLNLAHLRHKAHADPEAIALIERARTEYPDIWELVSFESEILRETNASSAAIELVEKFARDNWWHHGAALAAGRLYADQNDSGRAAEALTRASRLDIHDVVALNLAAQIRMRQNRYDEARALQAKAVARQPYEPSQYAMLSGILERMGRTDEARAAIAEVSRLKSIASAEPVAN